MGPAAMSPGSSGPSPETTTQDQFTFAMSTPITTPIEAPGANTNTTSNGHRPAAGEDRRVGKRPSARGTAFYPRKRANTACQVCRARKTKCDNKRPACSYCLSVGANCIQSPVDLSSFDPASLKILDRLDELERLIRASPGRSLEEIKSEAPLTSPSVESNRQNAFRTGGYRNILNDVDEEFRDGRRNSVLPERVEHVLRWPLFLGSQNYQESPPRDPFGVAASPPQGSATLAELVDLEPQGVNRLLDNFFSNVHCKNPILDEGQTRRMVRKVFLEGIDWSPASCLAMIICALSCIAGPFGPSQESQMGTQAYADSQVFFQAAQRRLGALLATSDIIGAQCFFLSGVYLMYMMQPVYAWRFFSQALTACQHFPFITRAQNLSYGNTFSADSMEMGAQDTQEQAVYWSAWKSERELRQELSLPDFDMVHAGRTLYPPFFPTPPQPLQNSEGEGQDIQAQRSRESWLFYLAEISLRRLNSRLCSELLSLRERYPSDAQFLDVLADMIPEYEAQAREWSQNLPQELSIQNAAEMDDICESVLRCHLIDLFELIYWPFVMAALNSHCQPMSQRVQEMAFMGLDNHVQRVHANEPGFYHRHHGAWLMMRSCTRSALLLCAAAKSKVMMPSGWQHAAYMVTGMLEYWSREVTELSLWKGTLQQELSQFST